MKLVYYDLNYSLEISKGTLTSLVLESPIIFEKFLLDFYKTLHRLGEYFALFDELEEIELSKQGDLISTPFDLSYEKRELQKKLYIDLCLTAEESDVANIFTQAHGTIVEALDTLVLESNYELEYDEEFSILDLFKNYGVQIKKPEGRFCEKLIGYMICLKRLTGRDFFIIINCDSYLAAGDYEHLEKCAAYYELSLLFVTNQQSQLHFFENEYILDADLCELH